MSIGYRRKFDTVLWMLADFGVILAAYSLVFLGRSLTATLLDYPARLPVMMACTAVMILCLYGFGVYRRIWSQTSGHEVTIIVRAMMLAMVIIAVVDWPTRPRLLPMSVVLIGGLLALAGVVALRYNSRLISGLQWRLQALKGDFPQAVTRVLIVGAGESGQEFAWRLRHRPQAQHQIVGFIDDNPVKHGMYVEGYPVLGSREDLVRITRQQGVDLVVVAIHNISGTDFRDIISRCEETEARIKVVPDIMGLMRNDHGDVPLRDIQPEDLLGRSVITWHKNVSLDPVRQRVILVTGAAGSIGSEVCRQLLRCEPARLILMDNNESGLFDLVLELRALNPEVTLTPVLVDITNRPAVQMVFQQQQPQLVFHAAAYKHVPMLEDYPHEALRVNIRGVLNMAQLAQQHQIERFVLVSTDKAVNPSSVMGASKRTGELILHALAQQPGPTRFTAVRFGNVLGSRGSVIPTFERQIDNGGPVTVTHKDMTRYFMSIPEAANLIVHAACLTEGDEIFILRMGEVVRIVDLAERMIRLRGLRPYKDVQIAFTGIRPGEKMHEQLYYDLEEPDETAHPGIIRFHTWDADFEPDAFFARVQALLAEADQLPASAVFQRLLTVIDPAPKAEAEAQIMA